MSNYDSSDKTKKVQSKGLRMGLSFCFFISLFGLSSIVLAQSEIDLVEICQGKAETKKKSAKMITLGKTPFVVMDYGFCAEYLNVQNIISTEQLIENFHQIFDANTTTPCPGPVSKDTWKIRFYASHSSTTYLKTNITMKTSRYDVEIKDYKWAERSSREFFLPETWKKEGNNPFQLVDEPSNTFVVSIEKNGNEFFISLFHPKFLQGPDQVKYISGTIDGTDVNGYAPINKPFDGWDQVPGESEIVRNQNTHLQMAFELGFGHRFTLLDSKRTGSLVYVPSLGVGLMTGGNYSAVIKKDEWWEFDDYSEKFGIQGYGGSITNRLEINSPKEYFGIFYENKLSLYKQNHGFLDGTQKYNLVFVGNSVGIKFEADAPSNSKKTEQDKKIKEDEDFWKEKLRKETQP